MLPETNLNHRNNPLQESNVNPGTRESQEIVTKRDKLLRSKEDLLRDLTEENRLQILLRTFRGCHLTLEPVEARSNSPLPRYPQSSTIR